MKFTRFFWIAALSLLVLPCVNAAVNVTRTEPPNTPTGVTATAVNGFSVVYSEESGALVNRTLEFTDPASDIQFMAADNDSVYFGCEFRFIDLHFDLSTVASTDVGLVIQASTGDDSWETLTVTDGTLGMTQSGSITLARSTTGATQRNAMAKATKDGSGNTIGDGTARFYWRIKRTTDVVATPPIINESGGGALSASTTYYYNVAALSSQTFVPRRSEPVYVNATTTAVKRTILISWDDVVWTAVTRSPTDGDFWSAFGQYSSSDVDGSAGSVKTQTVYKPGSYNTNNVAYVFDDGLPYPNCAYYAGRGGFYVYYYEMGAFPWAVGQLTVTGGTEGSPASFQDILDADVANGWNTFSIIPGRSGQMKFYTCHDLLYINDYFYDDRFTLRTPHLDTYSSTDVQFGKNLESSSVYGFNYDGGTIVLVDSWNGQSTTMFRFRNTRFYNMRVISEVSTFASMAFYDCTLKDAYVDEYQACSFNGAGMVMDNVVVLGMRYGLTVDSNAALYGSIAGLKSLNGRSINGPETGVDDVVTFRNFELVGTASSGPTQPLQYVGGGTMIFINPEGVIDWTKSLNGIGATFRQYVGYELDLKIVDESGTAINGSTVNIVMSNGTPITGSPFTTNTTGQIPMQDLLTQKYIKGASHMELNATYNPYTISISKDGFIPQTIITSLNEKASLTTSLMLPTFDVIELRKVVGGTTKWIKV